MELGETVRGNVRRKLVLHLDRSDFGLATGRVRRSARLEPSYLVIMQPGQILRLQASLQVLGSFFDACLNKNQVLWNELFAPCISWPMKLWVREKSARALVIVNWWKTCPSPALPIGSRGARDDWDRQGGHLGCEFGAKVSAETGWSDAPTSNFVATQQLGLVAKFSQPAKTGSRVAARLPFLRVEVANDSG